ncbi:MAG: hypothetical protein RIT27_2435 [Pseudomonadota bacterium]
MAQFLVRPFKKREKIAVAVIKAISFIFFGLVLYFYLPEFSQFVFNFLPFHRDTHVGEAVYFFLYDTPKVFLLLTLVVFVMGIVRSFFSPENTRALLSGKREGFGNIFAALLGIVTPFCSCSAVPLFIGFLSAGVPLGVTFSFLISAPMINEIALALLFSLFGWKIAGLYLILGLSVAIFAGYLIGILKLEHHLEDWVLETPKTSAQLETIETTWQTRFEMGKQAVFEIVSKVWIYIILGIAVGAGIHGFVPQDFMASFMGQETWWSVPLAVLLGIPMYANAASIIPIVEALLAKGAALGTVLAFMMSVIALSLPEMIILRNVLKPTLIAIFISVVGLGILVVGFLFNWIL